MKHLFLLLGIALGFNQSLAQQVSASLQGDGVLFMEGNDSILFYQILPKSKNGAYARANYIHPLYALDGEVLTEDFPADHLHHRGIFWAWHQLYVGEKRIGDGWEIKDLHMQVVLDSLETGQTPAARLTATVLWLSPLWLDEQGKERPLVRETIQITVYPGKTPCRQVDISISLLALEPDMRLGGSEDEKGYGGFSTRLKLTDDVQFTGNAGKLEPQNTPVQADGWIDISGSLGKNGAGAGMAILSHPQNPGYPNPWILRAKRSMQNAVYPFPGSVATPLSDVEPTVLQYRLLVHEGNGIGLDIPGLYSDYEK